MPIPIINKMAQQKGHMLIMENASDIIEAERYACIQICLITTI